MVATVECPFEEAWSDTFKGTVPDAEDETTQKPTDTRKRSPLGLSSAEWVTLHHIAK